MKRSSNRCAGTVLSVMLMASWLMASEARAECDLETGERMFAMCQSCHSASEASHQRAGPHLVGLLGRPAGTLEGFAFSPALARSGLVWNEENLDRFLEHPRRFLPGTTMTMAGIRQETTRAAIICWLSRVAGSHDEYDGGEDQ